MQKRWPIFTDFIDRSAIDSVRGTTVFFNDRLHIDMERSGRIFRSEQEIDRAKWSQHKKRNVFFMTLTLLEHNEIWEWLYKIIQINDPEFGQLSTRFIGAIANEL